jgi:PBP1b-binding outer membrane lipoprotein LpoB
MTRLFAAILCVLLLAGCAPKQTWDIDLDTDTAEDADYTSSDLLSISDQMITSIKANGFAQHYAGMHGGEKPVMILARALENNTDEHIDTRMILDKVRTALIKDGVAQFGRAARPFRRRALHHARIDRQHPQDGRQGDEELLPHHDDGCRHRDPHYHLDRRGRV